MTNTNNSIGAHIARIVTDPGLYTPCDPRHETRADEVTVDDITDLSRMPEAHCPHCGAPLETKPFIGPDGKPMFWRMFPEPCTKPECIEAERIAQEERDRQYAAEKEAQRMAQHAQMLEDAIGGSGLTRREIARATFDRYQPEHPSQRIALNTCREYAKDFRNRLCDEWHPEVGDGMGLYLHGPNGTGKSHLVKAIAGALIGQLYGGVVYRTDAAMYADIRAVFGRKERTARDIVDVFTHCQLLIIDDIGKAKISEWTMETLYELIDARYTYGRPVILTSNYSPDELLIHLGAGSEGNADRAAAIMSRLAECTNVVRVNGADHRRRSA